MLVKCLVICLLAENALSRSTSTNLNSLNSITDNQPRAVEDNTIFGDFKYVYKVFEDCAQKDLNPCLKLKLLSAMDRAARVYTDISIWDGVSFVKTPGALESPEVKTEKELEAVLPRSLNEKEDALNNLIMNKISDFFNSYTLQLKLPSLMDMGRSTNGEERGKKKGKGGYLLLPLILGGTMIPLALGALSLLAGKALIVSKLALVLASIIGLKKLLHSGQGGGHDSGHVEVVAGHGSGYGRSFDRNDGQEMAYNAYSPKTRR